MGIRGYDIITPIKNVVKHYAVLIRPSELGQLTKTPEFDDTVMCDNPDFSWVNRVLEGWRALGTSVPSDFGYRLLAAWLRTVGQAIGVEGVEGVLSGQVQGVGSHSRHEQLHRLALLLDHQGLRA